MIKFFRKIRQNLLSENKFSKYLIYAIGEIILVVIGILIALQINNLNESKKEKTILNASLNSLVLNLKEDIDNLNKQIDYNEDVQKAIDFSFRIVSLPEYENVALSNYNIEIKDIASEKTFLPSKTTYKSMESGSHFQWINNQELAESIFKYYIMLDRFSNLTNENNQFVKKHIESFIYNEMEFGTFFPSSNPYSKNRDLKNRDLKFDNTNILRGEPEFENALIGRKFRASGEINLSKDAITKATELINSIDTYLNE